MAEDKWASWNAKGNSQKGSNWSGDQSDYKRAEQRKRDEEEEERRKKKEPGMFDSLKKLFSDDK